MQDIAAHARVVKSAAYYYFPSKEAIIQAYYERVQAEQERLCEEAFRPKYESEGSARDGVALEFLSG